MQKAIHLFNLAGSGVSEVMPEFAYLALIKVTAEKQFVRLLNLDAEAAAEELAKLPSLNDKQPYLFNIRYIV